MYMKLLKCKLRMIKKISLLAFSMKNLATKGREKIVPEQTNQWTKTKSMNQKLNADFLMFLLQNTHNPTCKCKFLFSVSLMLWMQKRN